MMLPSVIDIITGVYIYIYLFILYYQSWKTLDILKEFDEFFGTKDISGYKRVLTNSREAVYIIFLYYIYIDYNSCKSY